MGRQGLADEVHQRSRFVRDLSQEVVMSRPGRSRRNCVDFLVEWLDGEHKSERSTTAGSSRLWMYPIRGWTTVRRSFIGHVRPPS